MVQPSNLYAPPAESSERPVSDESAAVEPAGFGIRFAARAIDTVVGLAIGFVAGIFAGILLVRLAAAGLAGPGWQQRIGQVGVSGYVLSVVAVVLNHTLAESMGGATIGKAVCGLRVRREDLSPCTFGGALIRSLGFFVDALFCGYVGYNAMSGSRTQQRLGDRWGKTVVVKAPSLARAQGSLPGIGGGIAVGIAAWFVVLAASIVFRSL
jgi:uncharacterized RDD family membrane protein YckC